MCVNMRSSVLVIASHTVEVRQLLGRVQEPCTHSSHFSMYIGKAAAGRAFSGRCCFMLWWAWLGMRCIDLICPEAVLLLAKGASLYQANPAWLCVCEKAVFCNLEGSKPARNGVAEQIWCKEGRWQHVHAVALGSQTSCFGTSAYSTGLVKTLLQERCCRLCCTKSAG